MAFSSSRAGFAAAATIAMVATVAMVAACSGDGPTPPVQLQECDVVGTVAGTSVVTLTGAASGTRAGRASAFEIGTTAALTVIDAYQVDAGGRPTAELFIFHRDRATDVNRALVPVTLAQLKDPSYVPAGSFVVYAEAFDAEVGDYTRWLVGSSGCIRLGNVTAGEVGSVGGKVVMQGSWQDQDGVVIGDGTAVATFAAPLLRIRTATAVLSDTLDVTLSGGDTEAMRGSTFDSFQVLAPEQTRLTLVGSAPSSDGFGRELWISLPGVPVSGDSIQLSTPTLEEAKAGRASGAFIMLRQISYTGIPVRASLRTIWRSASGWVKLEQVVQNGPLALCGWARARFEFTTEAGDLLATSGDAPAAVTGAGSLSSIFTVLALTDTLVDDTPFTSLGSMAARIAAPRSANSTACPA
jgi:hypothetical protein